MLTQKDIDKTSKTLKSFGFDDTLVDADAAAILQSATKAVQDILIKREALDEQGRENEPLIVLAGENHFTPSHYLHHLLVLQQLKGKESRTALAIEQPHDFLQKAFREYAERDTGRGWLWRRKKKNDNDKKPAAYKPTDTLKYQEEALYEFSTSTRTGAPYARNVLFNTCVEDGIDVKFVDAARVIPPSQDDKVKIEDITIDVHAPETRDSFKACMTKVHEGLSIVSAKGMDVRNHHMAKTTLDFAKDNKFRIILLQCGKAHLLDDEKNSKTLRKHFIAAGAPSAAVTGYLMSKPSEDQPHKPSKYGLIDIAPLPWQRAPYKGPFSYRECEWEGPPSRGPKQILDTHRREAAYVNAILAKTGMEKYGMTAKDYFDKRKSGQKLMEDKFKNWQQQGPRL